ncbi:MAG: hypothetical protein NTX61_03730 [Bacteroidetes bacterium]|nr:hypothetical protein [Bacteroidota bacterium]
MNSPPSSASPSHFIEKGIEGGVFCSNSTGLPPEKGFRACPVYNRENKRWMVADSGTSVALTQGKLLKN